MIGHPSPPAPVLALIAFFCGTLSGVFLKAVSSMPPAEAVAVRAVIIFAVLGAVILIWPRAPGRGIGRAGYARAALDAIAALSFALALFLLPLSLLASIHATLPILSVALSALLLAEPLPRRTLVALGLAFAGTLLILKPALSYSALGIGLTLLSVFAYALRDIATRKLGEGLDVRKVVLLSLVLMAVASLGLATRETWVRPAGHDVLLILGSGAAFLCSTFLIVTALRRAPVTRIAPLRYTAVLWALVFDALIWGYLPGPWAWGGIALILFAGALQHSQSIDTQGKP